MKAQSSAPWYLSQLPELDLEFDRFGGASADVVLIAALSDRTNFSRLAEDVRVHFGGWDCLAVAWHARVLNTSAAFFAESDYARVGAHFLMSRCVIVLRERWRWASLVNLTRGVIARRGYEHVALLLDDVKLGSSFNASELIALSKEQRLGVLSPRVHHGTYGVMEGHYTPIGWPQPGAGRAVRLSALEQYATLYSRAAWECMTSLMDDEVLHDAINVVGWGYDRCYQPHCEERFGGQALVPSQTATHCGSRGALYTHYRLGGLATRQLKMLGHWVRLRHNVSCSNYHLSVNQNLIKHRSGLPIRDTDSSESLRCGQGMHAPTP